MCAQGDTGPYRSYTLAMKEDSGRGWRRVVPSPKPKRIVELDSVKRLWDSTIVVTAGGGGIPVIENMDGSLTGVAAVIDKDLAAERLAEDMETDILLMKIMQKHIAVRELHHRGFPWL